MWYDGLSDVTCSSFPLGYLAFAEGFIVEPDLRFGQINSSQSLPDENTAFFLATIPTTSPHEALQLAAHNLVVKKTELTESSKTPHFRSDTAHPCPVVETPAPLTGPLLKRASTDLLSRPGLLSCNSAWIAYGPEFMGIVLHGVLACLLSGLCILS
jgi:hypothetical protein